MEDDDMTPICSVLVVVLLWYSLYRVAFLPPVNYNGALNRNMVPFALYFVSRERGSERRESESVVVIFSDFGF